MAEFRQIVTENGSNKKIHIRSDLNWPLPKFLRDPHRP
jgi:hypothetical protein